MARERTHIFTTRGELWVNPDNLTTGGNGEALGYTETGYELDPGDQVIEEPSEESGGAPVSLFFSGNVVRLSIVLKEWDDAVLKRRFVRQWDNTAKRIQIPGDKIEGDDMLQDSVVLLFIPDTPLSTPSTGKDPYLVAFKAIASRFVEPIQFRTKAIRKLAMSFLCLPDDSIGSGNGRYKYRTVGIGAANQLSLT